MGYLRGTGTQADPYVIHDASAVQQFFSLTEPNFTTNAYFSVVADIDCSSFQLTAPANPAATAWRANLNGSGHRVYKLYFSGSRFCNNSGLLGSIENLHLHFSICASERFVYSYSEYNVFGLLKNCIIMCDSGFFMYAPQQYKYATNVISNQTQYPIGGGAISTSTYLVNPSGKTLTQTFTGGVVLSGNDCYNPEKYPTLSLSNWVIDAVSLPRLIPNGRADLTTKYAIKGSTKVAGVSKKRKVAVMTAAYFGVLKNTYTDDNGNYLFDMVDAYDPVYVMHYDDYGFPLAINTAYVIGSYIHPKTPNGYRYKCTTAGNSGAELPVEPWPISANLTAGTAIFSPEPVYKTETFLVSPHLYDFLTGQPV